MIRFRHTGLHRTSRSVSGGNARVTSEGGTWFGYIECPSTERQTDRQTGLEAAPTFIEARRRSFKLAKHTKNSHRERERKKKR